MAHTKEELEAELLTQVPGLTPRQIDDLARQALDPQISVLEFSNTIDKLKALQELKQSK